MNLGQFDQLVTALGEMAVTMANYMKKLESEGFTRQEAFQLCVRLQTDLITSNKK
ncbi:hypothetical protein [Brevibacillus sp. MER 51]|uniref:hypothetical protein n=1 Tax=Brevibacillus sp. MER 51 TaxID=2939560 RepID=UPI00203C70F0|nr:hypothetical protein [Brevibacillus sp. MER 51]MCM3141675.1 hypothetical protein [Brevibacillus sp. MER 51]